MTRRVTVVMRPEPACPLALSPLAASINAAHWPLVRTKAHRITDIPAGGALAPDGHGTPAASVNAPSDEVDEQRQ